MHGNSCAVNPRLPELPPRPPCLLRAFFDRHDLHLAAPGDLEGQAPVAAAQHQTVALTAFKFAEGVLRSLRVEIG